MIGTQPQLLALYLAGALLFAQPPATMKSGIDIDGMDKSCKPCEDFYRYANGTFLDKNPIPAHFSTWGTIAMLREASPFPAIL